MLIFFMTKNIEKDVMIGLEIHVHLNTKEKLFCDCRVPTKESIVNSHICPRCTGQPGSKPMLTNKAALEKVIKIGLAVGASATKYTNFQRKHYTWPDMPTGFQRTVSGGQVKTTTVGGEFLGIRIEGNHLEENPAAWDPVTGELDYNRSGFPLAEFVTAPDFCSTSELSGWLKEFILMLKYLDCINMEYGIKSDVNVSVKESNFSRVEIKNVNSISNIVAAAEAEILRQRILCSEGKPIPQETRRYDDELDETQFMRSKENAQDYRFTPEPDLPNLIVSDEMIEKIRKSIPELPAIKRIKYSKYDLKEEDIEVIVSNLYLSSIFEHAISNKLNPREVGLFLRREIPRVLNYAKEDFSDLEEKNIKEEIITLIELLGSDKIAYTTAQKVLEKLYAEKFDVEEYIKDNNLAQVQDTGLIENLIKRALEENPKAVEDHKSGNTKSLNFIVGVVMRETKGTAKPLIVNEILMKVMKDL
jgi:aspartyl-tRNA(Asn)/glutamyl-tRNA(Gln) amidotransferase subunit B